MSMMNRHTPETTAKLLISTVIRAFYNDTCVALVDLLIRENLVLAEEVAPRMRLLDKDVRTVLISLENEMIIKSQKIVNETTKDSLAYYYIDYQTCVNAIRYRIFKMQMKIDAEKKAMSTQVYFQCPTCFSKYSQLEVLTMRSADRKLICTRCCPMEEYQYCQSEDYFRLVEIDESLSASTVRTTSANMDAQLYRAPGLHEGIVELLNDLKEVQLPRNLPSDNIRRGIRSTFIEDEDVRREADARLQAVKEGGHTQGSYFNNRRKLATEGATLDADGNIVQPSAATAADRRNNLEQSLAQGSSMGWGQQQADNVFARRDETARIIYQQRKRGAVDFLEQSGVSGVQEVLQDVHSLQQQRVQAIQGLSGSNTMPGFVQPVPLAEDVGSAAKKARVESEPTETTLDDVDWEED